MAVTKKLWFKSMACGCSWVPVSWQGWFVTLFYFLSLARVFLNLDRQSDSISATLISFFPYFVIWTLVLLVICYLTGEPLQRKL